MGCCHRHECECEHEHHHHHHRECRHECCDCCEESAQPAYPPYPPFPPFPPYPPYPPVGGFGVMYCAPQIPCAPPQQPGRIVQEPPPGAVAAPSDEVTIELG
jgi:hypothetical protein